jgi:hypothetical protein
MDLNRLPVRWGVLLLAGALLTGSCTPGAASNSPPAAAGAASTAAVVLVTLDYRGGVVARRNTDASLRVYDTGRVYFGNPFGTTQPMEIKLTPPQLEALMQFILVDQGFRQFDAEALKQELTTAAAAHTTKVTRLMDATTMVLQVKDGDQQREATVSSLENLASSYPEVPRLRQLLLIQRKLERLRAEAYAGGAEGLVRHLWRANTALAKEYPEAEPLKAEDLDTAWQSLGGRCIVKFLRSEPQPDGMLRVTKAEIDYPYVGDPVVITRVTTMNPP